jgi:hypothetical protein
MIDSGHLKRLLLGAAVLLLVSAGVALALGAPIPLLLGLGIGYILGAAPFLTWTWIMTRATASKAGRVLAVALLVGKIAFYAGVLYVGLVRAKADPVGVMIGMTGVAFTLVLGGLWARSAPAKEAS